MANSRKTNPAKWSQFRSHGDSKREAEFRRSKHESCEVPFVPDLFGLMQQLDDTPPPLARLALLSSSCFRVRAGSGAVPDRVQHLDLPHLIHEPISPSWADWTDGCDHHLRDVQKSAWHSHLHGLRSGIHAAAASQTRQVWGLSSTNWFFCPLHCIPWAVFLSTPESGNSATWLFKDACLQTVLLQTKQIPSLHFHMGHLFTYITQTQTR